MAGSAAAFGDRVTTSDADGRPNAGIRRVWSLEAIPTLAAVVILATGSTALLLAAFGFYRPEPALVAGATAFVIVGRRLGRETDVDPGRRSLISPSIMAGFVIFGALIAVAPSEHLYADRDPAVYNNTAAWISSTGGLTVDVNAISDLDEQLVLESPGTYLEGGHLEFQFGHLTGAFLAVVLDVGGPWAMFRTSAFVTAAGLLAVYCVARQLLRRPLLALVAPAALAFSMPVVAVGRDTYSEPYAMLLLWTGVLVMLGAFERTSLPLARLGGVLLGAGTLVRLDGIIYIAVALPVVVLAAAGHPDRGEGRKLAATALGWTVAVALIGVTEMWVLSTGYVRLHSTQLVVLAAAVGLSALLTGLTLAVGRLPAGRHWWRRWRPALAVMSPAVVLIVVAALWWLRPVIQVVRASGGVYLVEELQRAEGLELDGTRLYHEESVVRMTWYLGVVGFGLASIGAALGVRFILLGRASRAQVFVTAIACICGFMYLWNPSISPDHVWAMRRFVPAVLPALCLLTAWTIGLLVSWSTVSSRGLGRLAPLAVGAAMGATVIIPPLTATWPVRWQREQYGMHAAVEDTCRAIPSGSLVLVVGEEPVRRIMQTLRSWCAVDVVGLPSGDDRLAVEEIVTCLGSTWSQLVIVTTESSAVEPLAGHIRNAAVSGAVVNERQLQKAIGSRPDRYATERFQFSVYEISG